MNMIIRMPVLFLLGSLVACSTQVKGPVTGTKYKVDVGCTEDMQRYQEEREQVTGKHPDKVRASDVNLECPPTE